MKHFSTFPHLEPAVRGPEGSSGGTRWFEVGLRPRTSSHDEIDTPCASGPSALHLAPVANNHAGIMAHPVIWLILTILDIYFWVILIAVIMSWLIGFNVINGANPYVRQISYALHRLTEPLLGPIRRMLPDLGGIDISPIILLLALQFLRYIILYYAAPLL
jgi:YggT family protein